MGIGICMEIGKLIGICKQMHVCVYVCSHVETLFLNRFWSMIHQQTRIHKRKEFPKTDLKSDRKLKSYSGKTS